MKQCGKCKQTKSISEFAKKNDGLQSKCKPCGREYAKAHYRANINKYRGRTSGKRRILKEKYIQLKSRTPCSDCKIVYPYYIMDFDHREGTNKVNVVSKMVHNLVDWDIIETEIAKCDLVCSNCHRQRTHERGYGRI